MLGLEHLHLGYSGFYPASEPIHKPLAALKTGDRVNLHREQKGIFVRTQAGERIAALSKSTQALWAGRLSSVQHARVFAIVRRNSEQDENLERRNDYRVSEWEVPIIEVVTL